MADKDRSRALEILFGEKTPDKRYSPRTVLQFLGAKYGALLGPIAEHINRRLEEMDGEPTAAQLLALQMEGEALGLRAAILDEAIRSGLVDKEGKPNPNILCGMRWDDRAFRWAQMMQETTPKGKKTDGGPDVSKLWEKALATQTPVDIDSAAEGARQGDCQGQPIESENSGHSGSDSISETDGREGGKE